LFKRFLQRKYQPSKTFGKAEKIIFICLCIFAHAGNVAHSHKNASVNKKNQQHFPPFGCCWFFD
jgi:hypothetical protein